MAFLTVGMLGVLPSDGLLLTRHSALSECFRNTEEKYTVSVGAHPFAGDVVLSVLLAEDLLPFLVLT